MYAIRTSPGCVVSSTVYGEAGKMLALFTRDLGLVYAVAQGIRLEKSKLRYATQDFSFGNFSLVRGKEFWRLIDAQLTEAISPQPNAELVARLGLLVKRMLHGEEFHPELYDIFNSAISFSTDLKLLPALESLTVARMLKALGYLGKVDDFEDILGSTENSDLFLEKVQLYKTKLNMHINKALKESQL